MNIHDRARKVQRRKSDGGQHGKGQKGKSRRDRSSDVSQDALVTVAFSGSAASESASAADVCGGGGVVSKAERRPAGDRQPTQRVGSELPGEHSSTDVAPDSSPTSMPKPHRSHDHRPTGGKEADGHAKSSGLVEAIETIEAFDFGALYRYNQAKSAAHFDAFHRDRWKRRHHAAFIIAVSWFRARAFKALGRGRPWEKLVALMLAFDQGTFGNTGKLKARERQEDFANRIGTSRSTVQRALVALDAAKVLKTKRRLNPKTRKREISEYRVVDCPDFRERK
jgi:hypothetical protein